MIRGHTIQRRVLVRESHAPVLVHGMPKLGASFWAVVIAIVFFVAPVVLGFALRNTSENGIVSSECADAEARCPG